jgi:hypothetical protein
MKIGSLFALQVFGIAQALSSQASLKVEECGIDWYDGPTGTGGRLPTIEGRHCRQMLTLSRRVSSLVLLLQHL